MLVKKNKTAFTWEIWSISTRGTPRTKYLCRNWIFLIVTEKKILCFLRVVFFSFFFLVAFSVADFHGVFVFRAADTGRLNRTLFVILLWRLLFGPPVIGGITKYWNARAAALLQWPRVLRHTRVRALARFAGPWPTRTIIIIRAGVRERREPPRARSVRPNDRRTITAV